MKSKGAIYQLIKFQFVLLGEAVLDARQGKIQNQSPGTDALVAISDLGHDLVSQLPLRKVVLATRAEVRTLLVAARAVEPGVHVSRSVNEYRSGCRSTA